MEKYKTIGKGEFEMKVKPFDGLIKPSNLATSVHEIGYKILFINSVECFDQFSYKFKKRQGNECLINWKEVSDHFAGIGISTELRMDRYEKMKHGFVSWWKTEFDFGDQFMIFEGADRIIFD